MTSFPTTLVPTDPNAATTALGDGAKNHTDHHQAVDERLGDLQSAIGIVDLTGYQNTATFIDPNNADYEDGGWFNFAYGVSSAQLVVGFGDDVSHVASSADDNGTTRHANAEWQAASDGGTTTTRLQWGVAVNHDGSGVNNFIDMFATGQSGELFYELTDTKSHLYVAAQSGQASAIFELYDSSFSPILSIRPDGSVGGVAPSVGDSIKWDGTKWKASA